MASWSGSCRVTIGPYPSGPDDGRVSDFGRVECVGSSRPGEAEEHHESTREPDHVLVAQPPKALTKLRARHGGDVVDDQPTGFPDAGFLRPAAESSLKLPTSKPTRAEATATGIGRVDGPWPSRSGGRTVEV
jgi:hypothetical protein